MYTPNPHIHDRSLFWLGTGTSIQSSGVKLFSNNKLLVCIACTNFLCNLTHLI